MSFLIFHWEPRLTTNFGDAVVRSEMAVWSNNFWPAREGGPPRTWPAVVSLNVAPRVQSILPQPNSVR